MTAKVDFFIGIVLIILFAGIFYMTGKMPQKELGLGPGDYPRVIAYLIGFFGLLLSSQSVLKNRSNPDKEIMFEKGEILQVSFLVVCVAVYLTIMPYFGFVILTPVFMFVMMYIFGLKKWIKMVIISLVSTAIIYVLFDRFFMVLLPEFSLF